MQSHNDIILADGKPANGEEFHIWPDPTGRLGDARLWPHLIDFLCHGRFPPNWEQSIESFNELQLLRAFDVRALFFQPPEVPEQWAMVLAVVRVRLQSLNPNAAIAFCMHPKNDSSALALLKQLEKEPAPMETIALPATSSEQYSGDWSHP